VANVYAAQLDPNARYNVLVFSKTAAFRHSAIPNALAAIRTLERTAMPPAPATARDVMAFAGLVMQSIGVMAATILLLLLPATVSF